MKPIEIYNDKFLDSISWAFKVGGISLFPFIVLREYRMGTQKGKVLVNHETIHFWQTLELGIVGFYVLYLLCYLFNLIKYKDIKKAYKQIPFEQEAYGNERKLSYIKTRKPYSWIKYI
jgi:hypothetical protein